MVEMYDQYKQPINKWIKDCMIIFNYDWKSVKLLGNNIWSLQLYYPRFWGTLLDPSSVNGYFPPESQTEMCIPSSIMGSVYLELRWSPD